MVDEHSPGEIVFRPGLYFNVNQQASLAAIEEPDAHQFVGQSFAQLGVADHLTQFGVQGLPTARPVDAAMDLGEEEGEKLLEPAVESFLPWIIVITHGSLRLRAPFPTPSDKHTNRRG
ncbi:MAG TPA: hypothetical protein VH575_30840, partial [Gemmataceae bacterium]